MSLVATQYILYGFKSYYAGDILPEDEKMKPLWLESGAAVERTEEPEVAPKATRLAAPNGTTGTVDGAATQDGTLVGVVSRKGRKKATS